MRPSHWSPHNVVHPPADQGGFPYETHPLYGARSITPAALERATRRAASGEVASAGVDLFTSLARRAPAERDREKVAEMDEAAMVLRRAYQTASGIQVESVHRVQCEGLWDRFCAARAALPPAHQDSELLFHGTDLEVLDRILSTGFDPARSREGCALGIGAYFARDASYSVNYCKVLGKNAHSTVPREMIAAEVALGRLGHGKLGQRAPSSGADCAWSEQQHIYCLFDGARAYPAYVIRYRLNRPLAL